MKMIELPNTDKKVVSILSGGLDSTILTYMLVHKYGNNNVLALSFNYGQRHSKELYKAKKTCEKLNIKQHVVDISFLNDIIKNVCSISKDTTVELPEIEDVLGDPQSSTYVPFRNLIFSSLALSFAESNDANLIFLGIQSNDCYGYWDCTQEFTDTLNSLTKLNRKTNIQIVTPFVNFDKKDEILIGNELKVPFEDTWTCYKGDEKACGKCSSCAERIANFARAGIIDPTEYEIKLDWEQLLNNFERK